MKPRVLIIEDEPAIADTLIYALETEGFSVSCEALAQSALQYLAQQPVDFIILDVGLPDQNGFELCKSIRRSNEHYADVPILFLTARKEEVDRIIGLEIGGDDYVTKPFSPREISARVKTILKRSGTATNKTLTNSQQQAPAQPPQAPWQQGKFCIDIDKARVTYCNNLINLTRYEFLILRVLLAHPERIFSRAQLMDKVWDEPESSFERAVDTHIKSLRAKLRDAADTSDADPIKTHRGMGYSISIH
jgi:two-component system catabolic regulation response regulator CreB